MLECLILGDSIAVGIGMNRPDCTTIAKVGITSDRWRKENLFKINGQFKVVAISLSTNDWKLNHTIDALIEIRKKINANAVVWILPSMTLKPNQRAIVEQVANEFRDKVIDVTQLVGPDGIHPTWRGYQTIAKSL